MASNWFIGWYIIYLKLELYWKIFKCIWSENHFQNPANFWYSNLWALLRISHCNVLRYAFNNHKPPVVRSSFCIPWEQVLFFEDDNKTSNSIPFVQKCLRKYERTIVVFKYFVHQPESFFSLLLVLQPY